MQRLGYWLFMIGVGWFYIMPFRLIYIFSDFLALLMFYFIKYRKTMIINNLRASFPEKSEAEIISICKKSYKNLCDVLLEAIKGLTLKEHEIAARYKFDHDEKLQKYFEEGKSVLGTTAHLTNWEWGAYATGIVFDHQIVGVYKKVKQPYINQLLVRSRSKFDVMLAEMKETADIIDKYNSSRPYMLALIADQRPSDPYKAYWTNFLGRDTAFFYGAEKFSTKYNLPVFFFNIKRLKRGYYNVSIEWLCHDSSNINKGDIIVAYKNALENEIRKRPADWLWSHSRWKHPKPADFIQD